MVTGPIRVFANIVIDIMEYCFIDQGKNTSPNITEMRMHDILYPIIIEAEINKLLK